MNRETAVQTARDLLTAWAKDTVIPEPYRLDVVLEPADLIAAVEALLQARWGYLATITGLDLGPDAGVLEVLYHFCSGATVLTLRVRIPRVDASISSVCGVIPSASLYERELSEMFGITVVNTPTPERLFLPDSWPAGVYPLRKDFSPEDALRKPDPGKE